MEQEEEGGAPRQQFVLGTPIPEPSCGWLQQHHMGKFRGEFLLTMAEKEAIEAAWQPMAALLSLSSIRLKLLAMPDYESDMEVPDEVLPTMPGMPTAEDQSAAPGRAASAATPATSGRGRGRGRAAVAAASEAASAPSRGKGGAGKGQAERRSGRDRKTVDLYQAGQAPASSSKVSARQAAPKRATAAVSRKVQEPSPSKREHQKHVSRKSSAPAAAAATKGAGSSSSSSDDSDDSEESGSNKDDDDEDVNISEELQDLFASMSESESESNKKKKKKQKKKAKEQPQKPQVKKAGKEPAKKAGKDKQKGGRGAKRKSRSSSSSDADESPPPRQQAKKNQKAKTKEKDRSKEKGGMPKAEEAKRGPRGGRGAAAKAPAAPAAGNSSASAGKSLQKQQQQQKQPPPGLTEDEKKQLQDKIELLNDEQLDKVLAYLGCGTDEEGGMIVEIPLNTLPVEKQLGLRKLVEAELRADQGDEQGDAVRLGNAADAAATAQANPLGAAAVPDSPAFPTFEPGPTPRTPLAGATPQSQSHEDRGAGADNFAAAPRKHIWEDYSAREVQRVSQAREVSHSGSTPAVTPLGADPVVGDAAMPDLTLPAAALSGGGEAASTSAVQEETGEGGAPIMLPPPQFPVATENDSMMEQAAEVLGMMDG